MASLDLILVGGGLANGLIAARLKQRRPDLQLLVVESGATFGGNHTWSFHAEDLTPDQRDWTAPFVAHRWPFYCVAFPGLNRRVDLAYWSATSACFHAALTAARIPVRFGAAVTDVASRHVVLADGTTLEARAVIDGRGPGPEPHLRLGWQKFLGREIRLDAPHRLTGPLLMDATVAQADGYRFSYVLPLAPDRLLVEDTYYSDTPALDVERLGERLDGYARDKGWNAVAIEREETGVLPITLGGDIGAFWAQRPDQPCAGLRAGLFHPTTGYSWPDAVRLADRIAASPELDSIALSAMIRRHAENRWREQRFFRALNRMLFLAGDPAERWTVMRRFYRLPEPTITRFYAGRLSSADKLRLLVGRPPVPVRGALKALFEGDALHAGRRAGLSP